MYEGLRINFRLWHIAGGIYEYKKIDKTSSKTKESIKEKSFAGNFYDR